MLGGPDLFRDHLAVSGWADAIVCGLRNTVNSHRGSFAAACDGSVEIIVSILSVSNCEAERFVFSCLSLCLPVNGIGLAMAAGGLLSALAANVQLGLEARFSSSATPSWAGATSQDSGGGFPSWGSRRILDNRLLASGQATARKHYKVDEVELDAGRLQGRQRSGPGTWRFLCGECQV